MNNSIAWHDTFRTKYRVTKVVLQHVCDGEKKSFRWGFTNNIGCCVIICWNAYAIHASGLNWPIHPWWGHWDFRFFFLDRLWYQKILIFWIGCSLWLADFPFFSIWSPMWCLDFPIWIPVSLRLKRPSCASIDLEKPRNLCRIV